MKSHHAPTHKLLERFSYKDRVSRNRSVWVYEKDRIPRSMQNLRGQSVEHGYFAGAASGESEGEVDCRFANEYEVPFTRILPALDSNPRIFESLEVRTICARFMAHMFRRTRAIKEGGDRLIEEMIEGFDRIARSPTQLRAYAAKLSAVKNQPILLQELREALVRSAQELRSAESKQQFFVSDIDRGTGVLAAALLEYNWSCISTNSAKTFFISDTPVISRCVDQFGRVKFGVGIRRPHAEWFLPISHQRVLRVGQGFRSSKFAGPWEVDQLNSGQIITMSRRLYGREYSSWIDDMVQVYAGSCKFHADVFKGPQDAAIEDPFGYTLLSLEVELS